MQCVITQHGVLYAYPLSPHGNGWGGGGGRGGGGGGGDGRISKEGGELPVVLILLRLRFILFTLTFI